MELREIEREWKAAVLAGDDQRRRAAERKAAEIVPGIAARMAGLSDEEARDLAAR